MRLHPRRPSCHVLPSSPSPSKPPPRSYLSIAWSLLADALIFRQLPARSSMLGAALICGGGLLLTTWRSRSGFDASAAAGKAAASGTGKEALPGGLPRS